MKKILTYNLIFSLLISFVCSSNVSAANLSQGKVVNNSVVNTDVFVNQPVLKVELAKNNQIVIVANLVLSAVCKNGNSQQNKQDLAQAATNINFNQPANCFSLKVESYAPSAVKLFVDTLQATSAKIIVASQPQTLTRANFMPAPQLPGSLPVLASVIFILLVSSVSLKKKLLEKLAKLKLFENKDLVAYRFQILRC